MKEWLQHNKAPPQKVFSYLTKTCKFRRLQLLKSKKEDFAEMLLTWPRLFDTPGAVINI
jgi:hypothetical protein